MQVPRTPALAALWLHLLLDAARFLVAQVLVLVGACLAFVGCVGIAAWAVWLAGGLWVLGACLLVPASSIGRGFCDHPWQAPSSATCLGVCSIVLVLLARRVLAAGFFLESPRARPDGERSSGTRRRSGTVARCSTSS